MENELSRLKNINEMILEDERQIKTNQQKNLIFFLLGVSVNIFVGLLIPSLLGLALLLGSLSYLTYTFVLCSRNKKLANEKIRLKKIKSSIDTRIVEKQINNVKNNSLNYNYSYGYVNEYSYDEPMQLKRRK